ncbi:MAG: hypothetical protein GF401_09875 [Chitinivibrionales bacterium]|nr:hypothetical protein [Chitinivibrionales bacterium]
MTINIGFLLLGVIIGAAGMALLFAIVSSVNKRNAVKAAKEKNSAMKDIGELHAELEKLISSYNLGDLSVDSLRISFGKSLQSIDSVLKKSIHHLESYYVKYVENLIQQYKQFLYDISSKEKMADATTADIREDRVAPAPEVSEEFALEAGDSGVASEEVEEGGEEKSAQVDMAAFQAEPVAEEEDTEASLVSSDTDEIDEKTVHSERSPREETAEEEASEIKEAGLADTDTLEPADTETFEHESPESFEPSEAEASSEELEKDVYVEPEGKFVDLDDLQETISIDRSALSDRQPGESSVSSPDKQDEAVFEKEEVSEDGKKDDFAAVSTATEGVETQEEPQEEEEDAVFEAETETPAIDSANEPVTESTISSQSDKSEKASGKSGEKKKSDGDSIISGDDVVEKLDDFFGFE